jgi:site-specific DNA recombinase
MTLLGQIDERRPEFDHHQLRLDLGDLYRLSEEMNAGGLVVEWQEILIAMAGNNIQGPLMSLRR